MSLDEEELEISNTEFEENSESDNNETDTETVVQNPGVSNEKEKIMTEEELAAKCAENAENINYLDKINATLHETQILRPLFQIISASYADEVPFFVDGDSLLMTLIDSNNWSPQLGGCSLHLVYLFERYLNIFKERGGFFHIVFFECWRNIWNENWNILLYRSLLINHFRRNTSYTVYIFDNCFDKKFLECISYIRPGFILYNMETSTSCEYLDNIDRTMMRNVTNIHLIMFLYNDLPCIDTNFIEVDVSNVSGYYLEANPIVRAIVKNYANRFKKFIEEIPKIENCAKVSQIVKISKNDSVRKILFLNAATIFYNINQDDHLVKILFLTEALKVYLQLKNRCCPSFTTNLFDLNEIVNDWHKCMYFALEKIDQEICNWKTVADMWQGLLFGHVCRFAVDEISTSEDIGTELANIYENIVNDFNRIGYSLRPYPIHLSLSANLNWETLASLEVHRNKQIRVPLVLIKNPLVMEFCGDILTNIEWAEPPANLFVTQGDAEDRHFNILNALFDEYDSISDTYTKRPTDPYELKRYLRQINKHARYMTIYGSSIEGRPLEISGVVRDLKTRKNSNNLKRKDKSKKQSQKAINIIEKLKETKLKEAETGEQKLVENIKKCLNSNLNLEAVLNDINNKMPKIRSNSIYQLEILFLKLHVLMKILKENEKLKDNEIFDIKKNIYLCCHKICIFKPLNITKQQKRLLSKGLEKINCIEIAKRNGLLTKDDDVPPREDDTWIRFQLENLGPELVREVTGEPDPRVNFIPDPWQKKLFDIVDRKESAVIVAPTSSGKTYASYYCMESVLRESTDGIVVYVSPTKALVNQVAATVYARFKDTIMPDGMSVFGVFTRDFKTNALNSQILVTVPQAFEILLTSSQHHDWVQRLKYVIFDEVHCIAGDLGAVFFERCLLLIRCPFLALSATIRNPRLLQSWLQKAEDFKQLRDAQDGVPQKPSYKVNLVESLERHSDLIKYTYGNDKLHHLHPYAHLNVRVIKSHGGIPKHFTLSPKETIQLYDAMLKARHDSNELHNLSPVIFFASQPINGFISRNMVQSYANALKVLLETWFCEDVNSFRNTIGFLRTNDIDTVVGKGHNYILDNIVDFVLNLERNNMLPALIFAYNRNLIYQMAEELTEYFVDAHVDLANRRDEKKSLKQEKMDKKQKEREAAKNKLETKAKRYTRTLSLISNHNEKSLQGVGKMTSDDIKFIERQLMVAGLKTNDILTNAIRNGIMIHHGGLGRKIQSAVEMLFRSRILNVVFATGTLALGIHMPCKTTVVVGNSCYLNSLEYQQMSGRAGRRGFDTTGNVIFYGINPRKQHSLLTAKLPELKGNYPVTVTYVLRLMLLVTKATEKGRNTDTATKVTISRVMAVLENALSYMHNPDLKINIKHFFSFSLQFLKIKGYINENGEALKWVGLVTRLHYHEPGNLALVHLFRSGAIRQLCTESHNAPEDLLIVLSYLFNRFPLDISSRQSFNNSVVILEPLPDLIRQSLEVYNAEVKFIFDQYLLNVATHFNNEDNELPLSGVKFNGQHTLSNHDRNNDNLENKFINMCVPKLVCSSFAGLSGNDDSNLYSSEILIDNIKQKMSTDVKVIPLINLNTTLNSYALDFYKHGIVAAIRHDNGLKAGQEFTRLKDFRLILQIIVMSLDQMGLRNENDIVYSNFKKLESNYTRIYDKAFNSAHYN